MPLRTNRTSTNTKGMPGHSIRAECRKHLHRHPGAGVGFNGAIQLGLAYNLCIFKNKKFDFSIFIQTFNGRKTLIVDIDIDVDTDV